MMFDINFWEECIEIRGEQKKFTISIVSPPASSSSSKGKNLKRWARGGIGRDGEKIWGEEGAGEEGEEGEGVGRRERGLTGRRAVR